MRRGHPLVVIPFAGLLLALLLLILPPALASAQVPHATEGWYYLSQISSSSTVEAATFLDSQNGWAVGTNGGLFVTHDGGQTWSIIVTGISDDLSMISFSNNQTGYAAGDGILLRTTNGGASWQQTRLPTTTNHLSSLSTPAGGPIYVVAHPDSAPDGVYESSDGGVSWTIIFTSTVNTVEFVSASEGYAIGQGGVFHTTDGGSTWQTVFDDGPYTLIDFVSSTVGYVAGSTGFLRTMDGGASWTTVSWPGTADCFTPIGGSCHYSLAFVSPTEGLFGLDTIDGGAPNYPIQTTSDGGATWQGQSLYMGTGASVVGYRGTLPYAISHDGGFYYYGYPVPPPTETPTDTPVPPTSIPPTSVPTQVPPTQVPSNTPMPTNTARPTPTSPPAPSPTRRPAATATPHNPGNVGGDTPTPDTLGNTGENTPTPPLDQGAPTDTPVPPLTSAHGGNRPALHCRASNLQEVVSCVQASILRVVVHLPDGDAQGTAFVVHSDGSGTYLLTNRHVVDGGTPATVRVIGPDGHTRYSVKQIVVNTARPGTAGDLAILRLAPTKLRPLAFGNSAALKAGQSVASIGYGLAFQLAGPPSVTEGIVSAVGRNLNDGFGPVWIQHQSTINHGNSGGPLLDLHGNVVGINTLSIDQLPGASGDEPVQGVFFAIPANLARPVVTTLIARAQQPTSQLRATAPAPAHVTLANLSFTVSRGWLVSHVQRQQPTFSSRDQLVQMHVLTQPLGHTPDLAALIRHLARTFGPLKTLSTHHVTLAGLHGVQGSATFTHMAGRVTVTALQDPAQRRIVVIETVLHAGATTGDQKQASATLDSLRLIAPAHHKSHK